MNNKATYFYLNLMNEWPGFELPSPVVNLPGGLLTLDRIDDHALAPRGVFRGGPFADFHESGPWLRLRVFADALTEGTQIQIFTAIAENEPSFDPDANKPFADPAWQMAPPNELDILIANVDSQPLWIGGILWSDGQAAPVLQQMRVDFGKDSSMDYLPAIYAEHDAQDHFLQAFLGLHESILGGLEEAITDLPRLFDPAAVPADQHPSWLSWLASCLAFDLSENWTEAQTRTFLAEAFQHYRWRGTPAGLRRSLKWYADVEARIVEPGLGMHLWALGETSTLGFTTMLVPAQLQGAVLDTTAILDQSHLSREDHFGAALFDDVAHRFCVQIYAAELNRPGKLEDIKTIIEREKPAHTDYQLCVIEPGMRVGVQASVGIDSIVADGPPPLQVGMVLGEGVLSDAPEPCDPAVALPVAGLPVCDNEVEGEEI